MGTPSEYSYKNALETVEKFEARKATLERVEKDMAYKLKIFTSFSFKIDKKRKEIVFAGVRNGKVLIGIARCDKDDKYEVVLGKAIAVKLALKEDVKDLVDLVEKEYKWHSGTGIITSGSIKIDGASIATSSSKMTFI